MSQQFSKINIASTSRSTIDLSHHQVTTTDFGYIIPICVRDMVPNDDYVVKPSLFCRLTPLAFPTYGEITCRVHSFFVPYRILYPDWDKFIVNSSANQTVPPFLTVNDLYNELKNDPQHPDFVTSSSAVRRGQYFKLLSNLGLNPLKLDPRVLPATKRIAVFRLLAYYRVWLDWFMDSNIYDHSVMSSAFEFATANGGSMNNLIKQILNVRNCCFNKDYFTTAKINPQSGSNPSMVGATVARDLNPGLTTPSQNTSMRLNADGTVQAQSATGQNDIIGQFTIEELRAANALQRYLERNNYVGSKVIDQFLAHFGIAPTPERTDMSEYIGGSNFPIQIGDVTSTTYQGTSNLGLGMQAGKGVGAAQSETVRYHAKEHGVFLTLLSVVPKTGYYQGIDKQWTLGVNGDYLDYYTPEFENLGYQEILNSEVYIPDNADGYTQYDPDGVFGYAPRYGYLKFQSDVLGSDFINPTANSPMGAAADAFHLFRTLYYDDQSPLALNSNFTELNNYNNGYDRIFQTTLTYYDHFYFNIRCDVKATRPMTAFEEPSLDATNTGDGRSINLPYGGTRL